MSMEFRKFMSEDLVVWTDKITYLAYANYKSSPTNLNWYFENADKLRAIWRIKKIVTNTVTKITETYYPDADPAKTYARDDRAILNYI